MAVDSGLGREGVRNAEQAMQLASFIDGHPRMTLRGLYTHEGHAYSGDPARSESLLCQTHERLLSIRNRIDSALALWPGCSVTAARMAGMEGVRAVRPGTYVFGDLSLVMRQPIMRWDSVALTVLAMVVDRPEPELALLDAGSKTLSGDRTPDGWSACGLDLRDVYVKRCSEEHGWTSGDGVGGLQIGRRIRLVPAHVCPVVNLADSVTVVREEAILTTWRVAARGCVQ